MLPVLGSLWTMEVDCGGRSPGLVAIIGMDAPAREPLTGMGEVLVDLTANRLLYDLAPHAGGARSFHFAIPDDATLFGLEIYAQAVFLGRSSAELTNALHAVVGK